MSRLAAFLIAVVLLLLYSPAYTHAEETLTTPDEIIVIDRDLDGSNVVFVGEVIGESLRADDGHRWVNVLGDSTAVGVYVPAAEAATVESFGSYKRSGDVVRVSGVVNVVCEQHAGEFDVHATSFEVVGRGEETARPPQRWKAFLGIGAALVFVIEAVVFKRFRRSIHL